MSLKSISAWVALQQALRAVEAVGRFWAEQLALEPSDVLIILLFGREEQNPTTLSHKTGRKRQQVHRSLLRLEAAGLVEWSQLNARGQVIAWRLSAAGILRLECLERRMAIWEKQLDQSCIDVDALVIELRATMRSLVNRSMEGYFAGLYAPDEIRRDPNLEFVREAEAIRESIEAESAKPSPAAARREVARRHVEEVEKEREESAQNSWRNLWS